MKNKISLIVLLSAILAAVSCVKDQDPVFEKTASERLTEALDNAQKVLVAQENGWLMRYFPHPDQTYGGFTFVVKFTKDEVTAWGEIASKPEDSYTSYYKMTRDDGPVLSFDMDNFLLHYFATPSGTLTNRYGQNGLYEGHKGDFEFIILEATPQRVLLKGKRSGSLTELLPMTEEPVAYLTRLKEAKETNFKVLDLIFVSAFETTIGGKVYRIEMNRDMNQLYFYEKGSLEKTAAAFMYTPEGLRLYKPFELAGATFQDMNWDASSQVLKGGNVSWNYLMPEGWVSYDDFVGSFEIVYNDNQDWWSTPKTATVALEKDVEGESYWMTGLNEKYKIKVNYNLSDGNILIKGQIIGKYDENDVFFCPCYAYKSATGGASMSSWRSTNYGLKTKADPESLEKDPAHFVSYFVAGPSAAGKPINSFVLYLQKPDGSSGGSMSNEKYKEWYIFPGNEKYYSLFWLSMTKQ